MSKIKDTSTNYENKKTLMDKCPEVYAINLISGQWTLLICCYLFENKLRFGELKSLIPNITERMLSLELRKLEQNHLVKRKVYAEVPVRVEYELTEIGLQLAPVLKSLEKWGDDHKSLAQHSELY